MRFKVGATNAVVAIGGKSSLSTMEALKQVRELRESGFSNIQIKDAETDRDYTEAELVRFAAAEAG